MDLLTRIAAEGQDYLEPDGWLLSEIGSGQGSIAKSAFEDQGWRDVSVEQDYTGRDRVLLAKHGA
jgi:release factor glutamine methyltransferase